MKLTVQNDGSRKLSSLLSFVINSLDEEKFEDYQPSLTLGIILWICHVECNNNSCALWSICLNRFVSKWWRKKQKIAVKAGILYRFNFFVFCSYELELLSKHGSTELSRFSCKLKASSKPIIAKDQPSIKQSTNLLVLCNAISCAPAVATAFVRNEWENSFFSAAYLIILHHSYLCLHSSRNHEVWSRWLGSLLSLWLLVQRTIWVHASAEACHRSKRACTLGDADWDWQDSLPDIPDHSVPISVSTNREADLLHSNSAGDAKVHGGDQKSNWLQDKNGWWIWGKSVSYLPQFPEKYVHTS